jgi:DNA-binding transcriptional MerR regulator
MPDADDTNVPLANAPGGAEPRYKIGDVCRIADVQPYVLRYWESEFPSLAPDRTVTGPRTYSLRELRVIEQIKKLLYDEGYTIAGAKKKLESELGGKTTEAPPPEPPKPAPAGPREKSASGAKPKAPTKGGAAETAPVPPVTAPMAATPARPAADPRVTKAVSELKEILRILTRRP